MLRLCSVSYSSQLMLAYEYAPISLRQHVMQKKLMLSAMDMITMATQIAKVPRSYALILLNKTNNYRIAGKIGKLGKFISKFWQGRFGEHIDPTKSSNYSNDLVW